PRGRGDRGAGEVLQGPGRARYRDPRRVGPRPGGSAHQDRWRGERPQRPEVHHPGAGHPGLRAHPDGHRSPAGAHGPGELRAQALQQAGARVAATIPGGCGRRGAADCEPRGGHRPERDPRAQPLTGNVKGPATSFGRGSFSSIMGPRGAPPLPQVSGTGDIAPRKSALPSATVDISVKPSTATRSSLMHNNPTDGYSFGPSVGPNLGGLTEAFNQLRKRAMTILILRGVLGVLLGIFLLLAPAIAGASLATLASVFIAIWLIAEGIGTATLAWQERKVED